MLKSAREREYRGAVLSGRVEKALMWLKARVESVERKALVKVALCVEYPESHGRSTCTRGARVREVHVYEARAYEARETPVAKQRVDAKMEVATPFSFSFPFIWVYV